MSNASQESFMQDAHVTELHIWIVFANACHHFSPELADFKHIGLVDAA